MIELRFKAGDLVRVQTVPWGGVDPFVDVIRRDSPTGLYEVAAVLPDAYGQPKYRIRRNDGTPERIVPESQLLAAVRAGPVRQ